MATDRYMSFDDAQEHCKEGEVVAGCFLKDGTTPVYFCVDPSTDDDTMREITFQIREGRPMDDYQRTMIAQAKKLKVRS